VAAVADGPAVACPGVDVAGADVAGADVAGAGVGVLPFSSPHAERAMEHTANSAAASTR